MSKFLDYDGLEYYNEKVAGEISKLALKTQQNVMAIYNALANMAFVGERPSLDWGELDASVITNFNDPNGIILTDNSIGGMISLGRSYSGTLSANEGYTLSNVSVTMVGGGTITYNSSTGAIASSSVTGDITITATATFDYNNLGYTQSGLVFALDGIYKGSVADAWTDLIGGVSFANHGAISNSDNWQFTGTQYLGGWDEEELDFDPATCTLEVAYSPTSSDLGAINVCHFAKQVDETINCIYLAHVVSGGTYLNGCYAGGNYDVWACPVTYSNTVLAMSSARAFKNGQQLSALGVGHWSGNRQGRYIGTTTNYQSASPSFNKGFFIGKIHAIRIYNRQLTQAEILSDQAVDNTRFNLGLSL